MGKDELFPNDIFFKELDDKKDNWYSRMRSKMERVIVQRCIDNAQPVSDKAPAIGRDDMIKILEAYVSHGTRDSIVRAVALGTTYSANGRGSDIMTATWNLYHKQSIAKIFGFDWRTRKTSRCKGVWFVLDYNNMYICHYFLFAMLLMVGEGQDDYKEHEGNNHWVIKTLKDESNGGAKKLSNFLQDLEPSSKSAEYKTDRIYTLPEGLSSNSIRIGSLSELMSRFVSKGNIALAGGHDKHNDSEKNMWEYQAVTPYTVMPGAMGL
jgi:hypothetical protein